MSVTIKKECRNVKYMLFNIIGVATYLKVGATQGSRAIELGRMWEGFPLTRCEKFFIFKNHEVTSDIY